jgi:hypothetical protein
MSGVPAGPHRFEPVSDVLVLAAVERAQRHREREQEGVWLPHAVRHLGFVEGLIDHAPSASAARGLSPVAGGVWLWLVRPGWVRLAAERYADRLLGAALILDARLGLKSGRGHRQRCKSLYIPRRNQSISCLSAQRPS